jgi:CelD/BcsL family acetyltransferase involved in cellulose biosynthesis
MSSKQRGALRRNWKKLEETGPVRFEALAPDDAQFGELFETFLQVEATAWKRQKGTSLLQDDRARRFYTAYGRKAARLGMLRLFLLHVGDRVAAGQLHVLHADRLWALKIGYDEAFAQRSPGAVLTHEVLRYACQHGVKSFEHLGLAETWQTRWPTEPREHSTLRLYPASSRGAVGLLLDTADVSWAKLKARAQARLQPGTRRATGTAGAG